MKHLILGICVLSVILLIALLAAGCLNQTSQQLTSLLNHACQLAEEETLPQAGQLAEKAQSIWENRRGLVASLVDHARMDEIDQGFADLESWQRMESREEYVQTCRSLARKIQSLADAEKAWYYNFL